MAYCAHIAPLCLHVLLDFMCAVDGQASGSVLLIIIGFLLELSKSGVSKQRNNFFCDSVCNVRPCQFTKMS